MTALVCDGCALQLTGPESLNDRIGGFAALVGLVLVLVTLFTSQRDSHLRELRDGLPSKGDWTAEIWLNSILVLFTVGLFLAGLPILADCLRDLHPLRDTGPLRVAFVLVWLLLIALIAWQFALALTAYRGRKTWIADHQNEVPADGQENAAGHE